MVNYRRNLVSGGCYFFTLVTAQRQLLFKDAEAINFLRQAFRAEILRRPFNIQAIVVLPDHLHAIWQLPENDSDYSSRWREIKKYTSRQLDRSVWQRSFWEHTIRDDKDWRRHMDYIHFNPVRHGYVSQPNMWRHSSFHKWSKHGFYDNDWGSSPPESVAGMNCE